jgi:hypothetical protein
MHKYGQQYNRLVEGYRGQRGRIVYQIGQREVVSGSRQQVQLTQENLPLGIVGTGMRLIIIL